MKMIIKNNSFVPTGWDGNYGSGIVNFIKCLHYLTVPEPSVIINEDKQIEIISDLFNFKKPEVKL